VTFGAQLSRRHRPQKLGLNLVFEFGGKGRSHNRDAYHAIEGNRRMLTDDGDIPSFQYAILVLPFGAL
jgi:hypothetical protein